MSSPRPIYDPDRLNAFSDGIFAFAATLLVLQFTVPNATDVKNEGLRFALGGHFVSELLTFVLSFIIVTIYRAAHQSTFSRIEHTDSMVSRLNTFFLLVIAFLPFATALFSSYDVHFSFNIYAGTLAAAGTLLIAISAYANARPALVPQEHRVSTNALIRDTVAPLIFVLSIPFSYVVGPETAPYAWILIAVADPVIGLFVKNDPHSRRNGGSGQEPTVAANADEAYPS